MFSVTIVNLRGNPTLSNYAVWRHLATAMFWPSRYDLFELAVPAARAYDTRPQQSNVLFREGKAPSVLFREGHAPNVLLREGKALSVLFREGKAPNVLFREGHAPNVRV